VLTTPDSESTFGRKRPHGIVRKQGKKEMIIEREEHGNGN
jgi:hypothetical protein